MATPEEIKKYFESRNKTLEELIESPNTYQVGGKHYVADFQHWDLVAHNNLGYFEGQITKYVARWRKKNGKEDLEKAVHYLVKLIESIRKGLVHPPLSRDPKFLEEFLKANGLFGFEKVIIRTMLTYTSEVDLLLVGKIIKEKICSL